VCVAVASSNNKAKQQVDKEIIRKKKKTKQREYLFYKQAKTVVPVFVLGWENA